MFLIVYLLVCVLNLGVNSTDIAAVYKHGIILLKGAEAIMSPIPLEAEHLNIKLPKNLAYPIALAHDPQSGKLYVADANDRKTDIFSISFDGNDKIALNSIIGKLGPSTIESMSFDPVTHQLFWTDSSKNEIYSADLAQKTFVPNLIINKGVKNPRGLTVDFCRRITYWTERGADTRTIEQYNIINGSVGLVDSAKENKYFQGVSYNRFTDELIWAETEGDEEEFSSCRIVVMSLASKVVKVLSTFQNCYPFSLTSDKDYIYWSDWSRQGLMRLSRENPKDLVKLVNTPRITTEHGSHNGAFGIININEMPLTEVDLCSNELPPNRSDNDGVSNEEHVSTVDSKSNVLQNSEKAISYSLEEPFLNTVQLPTTSVQNSPSYNQLRLLCILLAVVSLFFMASTISLLVRNCSSQEEYINSLKSLFTALPVTVPFETAKSPRRFGPKHKGTGAQLCPRTDDGVQIDIEDCCQMTLCDTPCYTSMKKDGKGYKSIKQTKCEDKESLLDDLA